MGLLTDLIVTLLIFCGCAARWRGKPHRAVKILLFIYFSCVVYLTLTPIVFAIPHIGSHPYEPMHLSPFLDYRMGWGDPVRQILLNVLLFLPMGFLLPMATSFRMLRTVLSGFFLSLSIELLQPLLHSFRSSDITDLITNTAGCFLGYLLYWLYERCKAHFL